MATKRQPETLRRGRRTDEAKRAGRWRVSIREIEEGSAGQRYTTFLVQGWQEDGKWKRRKFKNRRHAEEFKTRKELENHAPDENQRIVTTTLTRVQAKDAENAVATLAKVSAIGRDGKPLALTLSDAAAHYAAHVLQMQAVEAVPLRDAVKYFLEHQEREGKGGRGLRERTSESLEGNLGQFQNYLRLLNRFTADCDGPHWTPPVVEITTEDIASFLATLRTRDKKSYASAKTWNNYLGDLHVFFEWCMGRYKGSAIPGATRRWHFRNPAADIARKAKQKAEPVVLSLEQSRALMRYVESVKGGRWAPYFAVALFSGIRPGGELSGLASHDCMLKPSREAGGRPLIDMKAGVITVTAAISKVRSKRVVTIQPNLRAWLERYGFEILGTGSDDGIKDIRAAMGLEHDVLRHTFISNHVAAFRNRAETALQAGNSEKMIKDHYLNLPTEEEAREFWSILPSVPPPIPET